MKYKELKNIVCSRLSFGKLRKEILHALKSGCRTSRTIIFPHSTDEIVVFSLGLSLPCDGKDSLCLNSLFLRRTLRKTTITTRKVLRART